jgi:glycosyltransferase involved in cell wall biosynthesis
VTASRIVFLTANSVTVDARVMRYIEAAGALGHDAVGVGVQTIGPPGAEEHAVPGGRVIVKRVGHRFAGRGVAARGRALFQALAPYSLTADLGAVRALAAHTAQDAASGVGPAPARAVRRLHALAMRLLAKLRAAASRQPTRPADAYLAQEEVPAPASRKSFAFYSRLKWAARWRVVTPERIDSAIELAELIDSLEPDIIHVHDVHQLGVGAWARARAARLGRRVALVYDAREYIPGLANLPPRVVAALSNLEAEFIGGCDRVVSVSEAMADRVARRNHLPRRPDVVLNAPVTAPRRASTADIRALSGVDPDSLLLVYGGGVNPARGVQTAIRALPLLEGAHLSVVMRRVAWMPAELTRLAESLGVADRLHVVPFVDHDQVPAYFASADIGLSPLLRAVNHDVTITNKFCEYIQAGLPIVTSDTPEQATLVADLDLGAVHTAGDPASLAEAVRSVEARLDELKARLLGDAELRLRFSWEGQVPVLQRVWREALAEARSGQAPPWPITKRGTLTQFSALVTRRPSTNTRIPGRSAGARSA